MKKLIPILLLFSTVLSAQRAVVNIPAQVYREVFADTMAYLGYGQSNRYGRGFTRWGVDTNTNVQLLEISRGRFRGSNGQYVKMDYPLEMNESLANEMGMEVYMAQKVFDQNNRTILASYTAWGGEQISRFLPGSVSGFWDDFTSRNSTTNVWPRRKIEFFTWHQGESDVSSPNPSTYITKLQLLKDSVDAIWGDIPWIIGEPLPSFGQKPSDELEIKLKLQQAPDSIDNVYFVPSWGIYGCQDYYHFDPPGYEKMGKRFGMKINDVVYHKREAPEKPHIEVYLSSTTAGVIRYDYIFSTTPIEKIVLYVNGSAVDSSAYPRQTHLGSSFNYSGGTISGNNVWITAKNVKGTVYSDTVNVTYSASVPAATHIWLCNETSGTAVDDSGSGNIDGTLSVNASTVTTTLNGSNAFQFSNSQYILLSDTIELQDTVTIYFEAQPTNNGAILGLYHDGLSTFIIPNFTLSSIQRFFLSYGSTYFYAPTPTVTGTANNKYCLVLTKFRGRLYVNSSLACEFPSLHGIGSFKILHLGSGQTVSFDKFAGKFRNIKIWQGTALSPGQIAQL